MPQAPDRSSQRNRGRRRIAGSAFLVAALVGAGLLLSSVATPSPAQAQEVCFRVPDRMDYMINDVGECCLLIFGMPASCMPGSWYDESVAPVPSTPSNDDDDVQIEWANPDEITEPEPPQDFF